MKKELLPPLQPLSLGYALGYQRVSLLSRDGRSKVIIVYIIRKLITLLRVRVNRKLASSLSACRSAGLHFIPLVAKTLGGLADDTIQTVRSIGKAIADRVGTTDSSNSSKHLFGRLAIALWRGNACLWLHRLPTLPPSLDGVP